MLLAPDPELNAMPKETTEMPSSDDDETETDVSDDEFVEGIVKMDGSFTCSERQL